MNLTHHLSAFVALIFVIAAVSPALAEETVFTSNGFHRKIETFIDSNNRFAINLANPNKQLIDARDTVDALKSKGGLPYATAATELGCILFDEQKYDEAEPLLKEALEIRKAALTENDQDVAAAMHNLGALYELRKSGVDPADFYFSAMKIVTEQKPTLFRAYEEQNLGEFLYDKKSLDTAEAMFRRSVKDHDKLSTKPSAEVASLLQSLSLCMEDEGHGAAAVPFEARSEEMFKRLPKTETPKGWTTISGSGP